MKRRKNAVIIGAGPAGLTAAYQFCKEGVKSVVIEKDDIVGGLSRTVNYQGYLFDIGGHRFYTKVRQVDEMWHEVLGAEKFVERERLSRIYYKKRFFYYPLRAFNALFNLGLFNSFIALGSYLWAKLFPVKPVRSFEDYICNHFGRRLYRIFFKNYTEKVWGLSCKEISADWAAQRIRGLSLKETVKKTFLPAVFFKNSKIIKTLIEQFHYPEKGPGQMWETVAEIVQKRGAEIKMESDVDKIFWDEAAGVKAVSVRSAKGFETIEGTDFISSMPMRELIRKLDPPPPAAILEAAEKLGYRDFLTVSLIINSANLFDDNWIYIHDEGVKVGRIQNFKNWSPGMVPDQNKSCLGLEYFCFEGDGLWTMADEDLVKLGTKELAALGLVKPEEVEDGSVVRMPKAYPIYDSVYTEAVETIKNFCINLGNLHLVGRNGMHKYNNQDHSMLTAMLTVKNILGANYDVWKVNVEKEYHEEEIRKEVDPIMDIALTQPRLPQRIGEDNSLKRQKEKSPASEKRAPRDEI